MHPRRAARPLTQAIAALMAGACLANAGAAHAQTIDHFTAGITPGAYPFAIASGPDGNVWFTEIGGRGIARITPAGVVTEFVAGSSPAKVANAIAAGADGNMWFTAVDEWIFPSPNGDRIGRITPAGVVTE